MQDQPFNGSLPAQATDVAARWDIFYWFLVGVSVFFFVLVVGLMIYFIIKYRHRPGRKAKYITGHHTLEIFWTAVPTVLLMIIFAWGWVVYRDMVRAPSGAMEVRVTGKQWLWEFQYDDGRTLVGDLFVPVNTPVKLIMTSTDVLHSFFIPNFRVKQDVVPGMYTTVTFEATIPGMHQVYCAEYCGGAHSGMLGRVIALKPDQWNDWKRGKEIKLAGLDSPAGTGGSEPAAAGGGGQKGASPLVTQGKKLMAAKGCVACHSDDGSKKIGPSYKGIFGSTEEMADGTKVEVDENYLREAILNPQAKIVKGYEGVVMPPFQGLLSEDELAALIAYIKSLK